MKTLKKIAMLLAVPVLATFFFTLKPARYESIFIDNKVKSRRSGFCGEWVYISRKDYMEELFARYSTDPDFFYAINDSNAETRYPGGFWFFPDASQVNCFKQLKRIPESVKWLPPVEGETIRVTSTIGTRYLRRKKNVHVGIDIHAPVGTRVYAMSGGRVAGSLNNSNLGNFIVIKHDNGTTTLYAHLSRRFVSYNERVELGQTIGMTGNTGNSTGPHLHLEMKSAGAYINGLSVLQ